MNIHYVVFLQKGAPLHASNSFSFELYFITDGEMNIKQFLHAYFIREILEQRFDPPKTDTD